MFNFKYNCINCQRNIPSNEVRIHSYIDFCNDLCFEYFCPICYKNFIKLSLTSPTLRTPPLIPSPSP